MTTNYAKYPGLPKQMESTYLGRRYREGVVSELTGSGCTISSTTSEGATTTIRFSDPDGEPRSVHFYELQTA